MPIKLFTLLVGAALWWAAPPDTPGAAAAAWWTTHALSKVRPGDPVPAAGPHAARIAAARNEFEPFQIVLHAGTDRISGVDVEASDLTGTAGSLIGKNNISIYLEKYLNLTKASSVEGGIGEWPDALIPRVDQYSRERRNAFPFNVEPGRNQAIWIEVYVPPDTPAGVFDGTIKLASRDQEPISVPLTLTVWNFALPSTSSLSTAFGFSGTAALRQHRGRYTSEEDLEQLTFLYAKSALLHRISIGGGTMAPPEFQKHGDRIKVDWRRYDEEVGPFLNGTALKAKDPLPGAKATSVDLRTSNGLTTDQEKALYWKEWVRHFRENGWLDRLYRFVWDEPPRSAYQQVIEKARVSRLAGPEIRNLLTAFDPAMSQEIDIWVPLINCMASKPGFPDFCEDMATPAALDTERSRGKTIWWYESCASHGCGEGSSTNEYFRGWPSYVIDVPAISNRILPWLAWRYRISGELYYSMDEIFGGNQDPWKDMYAHGGNGDGTLFYPGRPQAIGGHTDIPIESIRLKLIREGLEDYEYLVLLSRQLSVAEVDRYVAKLATNLYGWKEDPELLYSIRSSIGEILSAGSEERNTGKTVVSPAEKGPGGKP